VEAELIFLTSVGCGSWDSGKVLAVGDGESGLSRLSGPSFGLSGLSGLGAPVAVGSCLGTIIIGDGRRRWYIGIVKEGSSSGIK